MSSYWKLKDVFFRAPNPRTHHSSMLERGVTSETVGLL